MNYSIIKILPLILSILILLITNPNLLNNNHNLQANDILDCGLTEHFISFLNDKGNLFKLLPNYRICTI